MINENPNILIVGTGYKKFYKYYKDKYNIKIV